MDLGVPHDSGHRLGTVGDGVWRLKRMTTLSGWVGVSGGKSPAPVRGRPVAEGRGESDRLGSWARVHGPRWETAEGNACRWNRGRGPPSSTEARSMSWWSMTTSLLP